MAVERHAVLPLVERNWVAQLDCVCVAAPSGMLEDVGLDRELAERLADDRLAEWRRLSYEQWRQMLDGKELREVVGDDGKRYSVVSYALDDGDGRGAVVVEGSL